MMYYYWREKGIRPSVFHSMPSGELTVIRAFYEEEIDEKEERKRQAEQSGFACPYMFI